MGASGGFGEGWSGVGCLVKECLDPFCHIPETAIYFLDHHDIRDLLKD
jgi:hypothetical protein